MDQADLIGLRLRWEVGDLYGQLCRQRTARHDWIDVNYSFAKDGLIKAERESYKVEE